MLLVVLSAAMPATTLKALISVAVERDTSCRRMVATVQVGSLVVSWVHLKHITIFCLENYLLSIWSTLLIIIPSMALKVYFA